MAKKAFLVLGNGRVFEGKSFGATGSVTGEAVFTTGMTGYLETLTDPSYHGQIVMQTFPLIGNYGVIEQDFESTKLHPLAYIVRDICEEPSNFRCEGRLSDLLIKHSIVGLYDVDTREITKIIRESGVMNARILQESEEAILKNEKQFSALIEEINAYTVESAVKSVTCNETKTTMPSTYGIESAKEAREKGLFSSTKPAAYTCKNAKKVVLWDYGAKGQIRRELAKRNCEVVIVPSETTAEQIIAFKPDGVMLSNGPGDPIENTGVIEELAKIVKKKIPLFGICLGHQLLALAHGAKTEKLKYGHRGANQPVKEVSTGRVFVSSQNHGYTVIPETLPKGASLSFINTNDNTCEGVRYADGSFSVQFHPEASAGPLDTAFLFDDFAKLMDEK